MGVDISGKDLNHKELYQIDLTGANLEDGIILISSARLKIIL